MNLDPAGFADTEEGHAAVRALGWMVSHPVDGMEIPIWVRLAVQTRLGPLPEQLARFGLLPSPYRAQLEAPVSIPMTDGTPLDLSMQLSLSQVINRVDEGEDGDRAYTASNCLLCHAGVYGDQVVVGAPNKNLNLEPLFRVFDDLTVLRQVIDTDRGLARQAARLAFGVGMARQGRAPTLGIDISEAELDVLWASSMAYENHVRPLLNPNANAVVGASAMAFAGPYMLSCSLQPWGETLDSWDIEDGKPGELFERMKSVMLDADGAAPISNPRPWWLARYTGSHFTWHSTPHGPDHSAADLTVFTSAVPDYGNPHVPSFFDRADQHHDIMTLMDEIASPTYPHPVDWPLAESGLQVYDETCARCHGVLTVHDDGPFGPDTKLTLTYDAVEARIPHHRSHTDPAYTRMASDLAFCFDNLRTNLEYEASGIVAALPTVDDLPFVGSPPLIGIWASAPYLHNQSVPTLRQVLDSTTRPDVWRLDPDPYAYDYADLGVVYASLDEAPTGPKEDPFDWHVYDTHRTANGMSNGGHRYGDRLSDLERDAVLELLKALGTDNVAPDPIHLRWDD